MGLEIAIAGRHRTVRLNGRIQPAPDLPASTPLALRLRPGFDREIGPAWEDDDTGTLEARIAPIVAEIIAAGEATFRRNLCEAEQRAERERLLQEERRREAVAELNRQRLQHLHTSGELLRQAEEIQAVVRRVREAILGGSTQVSKEDLEAWERWALAEADGIDPVRSGQFISHLQAPKL